MKNTHAFLLMLLVLALAPLPFTTAQEDATIQTDATMQTQVSAGITPASPFYGIDKALDNIRISLAGSNEKRAEIALHVAQERLEEIKEMEEQNNTKASLKAQIAFERAANRSATAAERIEQGDTAEESRMSLEELTALRMKTQLALEHVVSVHEGIVSRQADRMNDTQLAHLSEVFDRIAERFESIDNKTQQKIVQARTRLKLHANLTEEQSVDEEHNISARVGLQTVLERRAEHLRQRIEENAQRTQEHVDAKATAAREHVAQRLDDQLARITAELDARVQENDSVDENDTEHEAENVRAESNISANISSGARANTRIRIRS